MKTIRNKQPSDVDPEKWLDEYGDWLYQFALARVQNTHAAEDLVQETLVAGFRGFSSFQNRSSVKTWLTAILRRRIADYFEQLVRQRHGIERSSDNDESDHFAFLAGNANLFRSSMSNHEFESSMEREEFWDIVRECLDKLAPHLKQAFLARIANDGQSLEEISDQLSVTKSNLGVRLFRSRLLLRECLERFWTQH